MVLRPTDPNPVASELASRATRIRSAGSTYRKLSRRSIPGRFPATVRLGENGLEPRRILTTCPASGRRPPERSSSRLLSLPPPSRYRSSSRLSLPRKWLLPLRCAIFFDQALCRRKRFADLSHQEARARSTSNRHRVSVPVRGTVIDHSLRFLATGIPLYGPSDSLWEMIFPLARSILT